MKKTYQNPLPQRADDPWVVRDGDSYLYCYSIGRGVAVTRSQSLPEIARMRGSVCYRAPKEGMYSQEYWAPELHKIDGRWYIYVAADDGANENHRMYCLGATTDDPTGEYEMIGKITDESDKWAIDGTVFHHNGSHYFIWSGWEGDVNVAQNLYIAHMSDASTIDSPRVLLSTPEYEWEQRACVDGLPTINEGPAILTRDGKTFLVYSASGSWSDDYCLGMLELIGDDPLNPECWKKYDEPVFEKNEYCFGPGHCSFTTSPDGAEDYMAFHGNPQSGTGWGGRRLFIQRVMWEDGMPMFGTPSAPDDKLPYPSDGLSRPHGRLRPALTLAAMIAMGCLGLALILVIIGAAIGREGGAWLLPLVAIPVIVELVILWQKNMDWLGKFLLTNDGILCESPLAAPILLHWDEIADCCFVPGKGKEPGTYWLSTERITLSGEQRRPSTPAWAKVVKIGDRAGMQGALAEFLPNELMQKLIVDRAVM